ncbi:MAG TPA: hypothetical protein VFF85_03755, partial [Microbacterium sp.]|nr:hypothetical protein [Microbacterium sp.]
MRKTSAALATLSLAVLALTGCSSTPSFDGAVCDRTANASTTLADSVSTSGDVGSEPKVEVYAPVSAKSSTFVDAVVGDGTAVVSA